MEALFYFALLYSTPSKCHLSGKFRTALFVENLMFFFLYKTNYTISNKYWKRYFPKDREESIKKYTSKPILKCLFQKSLKLMQFKGR